MKRSLQFVSAFALFAAIAVAGVGETNSYRFSFGEGQTAPGFTAVKASALSGSPARFGFEPGANIKAQDGCITSGEPFRFSIKLPEGNYTVAVGLGGEKTDSCTTVKAEARRLMLENIRTAKGQFVLRRFTVNVRTPRIDENSSVRLKQREKDSETVTWDDALTLEFNGPKPCVRTLEIEPAPPARTIFLAGDSTVCDQPTEPWNSWGQMLPRFFKEGVAIANYAQSGESLKTSLSARRFEKIFSVMKPGDWLLVQFGHNDMKDRAADALDAYRKNLKHIVARTRAKGGTPVLITSMERKAGVEHPTLAGYPDAVRQTAKEESVAIIDLQAMSVQLYRALGTNLDLAFQDGTHHNSYGSYELAKCVAAGIGRSCPDLASFVLGEAKSFDPSHPDGITDFHVPPSPPHSALKPDGN